jgi:diguanylate cyclase (GGDEF)-like protein
MPNDTPGGMIAAALAELRRAAALEGCAVIDLADRSNDGAVLYESGIGASAVIAAACTLLRRGLRAPAPAHQIAPDHRPIVVFPWTLPPGRAGGLVMWRVPNAPGWETRDHVQIAIAGALLKLILTHGPAEAGIDRLTGLPNRHYFLDEVDRHLERLEKDELSGTLLLVDLDGLDRVNEVYSRAAGDWLLARTGMLLRAIVRPSDLVARVGGDEFAVWLYGMDHLTAAERAETLRERRLVLPAEFSRAVAATQTLSIGIASRMPGCGEDAETMLRRARMAAYEAKQAGGAAWRVALPPPPPLPGPPSIT